jgi:hypothetical protein
MVFILLLIGDKLECLLERRQNHESYPTQPHTLQEPGHHQRSKQDVIKIGFTLIIYSGHGCGV